MNAKNTYGFILAGCLSVSALVLFTSVPGWAENPYTRGHRAPGSFAKQHGNQNRGKPINDANRQKEAQRRAHLKDKRVESSGTFVQHPNIPQSGVDQKGGVYDKVRRENPELQHPVNTPRQNSNTGNGGYKPIPNQQQPFNIQPKQTGQPQQQQNQDKLNQEKRRQALFDKFDAEYVANCKRTRKPDCTPPSHPTSTRGTSSYVEGNA